MRRPILRIPSYVNRVFCLLGLLFAMTVAARLTSAQEKATHPLDPLTKEEIQTVASTLKAAGKVTDRSRFISVALLEPPKAEVLGYTPGTPMRREAFAVLYERETNQTFEAVVDVRGPRVLSWKVVPGVQPAAIGEDYALLSQIVHADAGWQQAMRKRGITDFEQVAVDPWPGEAGPASRQLHAVSFLKGSSRNYYSHPIEGVVAYVNLNTKRVERLVDTGVVPVPKADAEYDAASVRPLRTAPRPLQSEMPDGPSFTVEGQEVRWQNWRFRFALTPREGLVLYTVGYEDQGRVRSILYRASVSELFVPYGDPGRTWYFRKAFDEGENGLGLLTFPMAPGADVPANARFFSAVFASDSGEPEERPRVVALYERDGGILWRHTDLEDLSVESRRARELVLTSIATAGNYDYGFQWIFHQDGTLEEETLLTGIMQTKGVRRSVEGEAVDGPLHYGTLVMPQVEAVQHQHFFNFRLDLDVDGADNCVKEMNTEAVKLGPGNPYGNAFVVKQTTLATERQAKRPLNSASNRCWVVVNCGVPNALGRPVGYALMPGQNTDPCSLPASEERRRAGFLDAPFWATRYAPDQRYAAGDYPNQSRGGDGLPAWIRADRPLENTDVVIWYTMGVTHIPRPEEWPIMAVHCAGFQLVPMGFFTRNPALDVPPVH